MHTDSTLNELEKTVVTHTLCGLTAKECADVLGFSEPTIKAHKREIIGKYNAPNMVRASVLYLHESGHLKTLPENF